MADEQNPNPEIQQAEQTAQASAEPQIQQAEEDIAFDPNTMPGLSNGAPDAAPTQGTPDSRARTKLDERANESWGISWLDNHGMEMIIQYANPDMAEKTKKGFKLKDKDGSTIEWLPPSDKGPEFICKKMGMFGNSFSDGDANTIVCLAKLRGWKSINVHGTVEQKEKLWLAVMQQNLADYSLFHAGKLMGPDGKPVTEFHWTTVPKENFTPLKDSAAYQQMAGNPVFEYYQNGQQPAAPAQDAKGPETAAPEQPAPEQPAPEQPAPETPPPAGGEGPIPAEAPPVELQLEAPTIVEAAPEQPVAAEPVAAEPPAAAAAPEEPAAPVSASRYTQLELFPARESRTDITYTPPAQTATSPEIAAPEEQPPPEKPRPMVPKRPSGPGGP